MAPFLKLKESLWWDNKNTANKIESKSDIINESFLCGYSHSVGTSRNKPFQLELEVVHTLELEHPLGKQKPLDRVFNLGPYAEMGGIETVNNQSFNLTADYRCRVNLGPALRRILDFADTEHGVSINPSGQSGNFMSPHYGDQCALYVTGQFRQEMMNQEEIIHISGDALVLSPKK